MSIPFPIITIHDFEMIHEQGSISDYTSDCTIYAITQRSAIYFDEINVTKLQNEQVLYANITDGINSPIACKFRIPDHWKVDQVEFKFYNKKDRSNANGSILYKVEAIQLRINGNKLEWICPTDFIARHYQNPNSYIVSGDISPYMNYKLLYIGKATKQSLTKRLSNHRKLTRIISLEEPINTQYISLPHELTIICFNLKSSINQVKI